MTIDPEIFKQVLTLEPKDFLELINIVGTACLVRKMPTSDQILLGAALMNAASKTLEKAECEIYVCIDKSDWTGPIEYLTGDISQ